MNKSKNTYTLSILAAGCLWGFMGLFRRYMGEAGFSSSGVISGRSIICKLSDGSFLPLLTDPDNTVRLPRALDSVSADVLFGANPPKIVSCVLSTMISAPSFP